ncbi:hypothetical protein Tco_1413290 [Tanacetum coccineum]
MDLYHSRLTPDDLNVLIIKFKIPRNLHPRLPSEYFVMSELLDDAIGIYHRMFDFYGVRILFSSFFLALIKHYRVYFSQLRPLCLNKVITFEVLCRSLQIEPTVTLFRIFQTLCKQGDWFSFSKRRAPSLVCIDDNRSCMKHWKSGFFLIDRRAIPDAILRDMPEGVLVLSGLSRVWKSHVYDPVLQGADGNVMGIHDFLCLTKWTGAEVQEEPHLDVRSTLQRLPFYCTPPAADDFVIPDPTPEDLAACSPSSKIRTRSVLAQSSGRTTCHSFFVGNDDESDDDDDACVEILLVTPLRSAVVIPSSGNQGGSSAASTTKGSNLQDSRGKGVMVDDAAASSTGASRPRPSSGPAPSFRNVFGDAIHTDFFSFSAGPYYATYPVDGVAGNWEMVQVESLSDDQLTAKMSVLHCMMMSHSGELLACYRGLNQSHHEYVLSTDSRLKGYEEKLSSSDASFAKSKAKGKARKKKIKSFTKSVDNLHSVVARLSVALNQATVLEAEKDEEILQLKTTPPEFSSFFCGQF